jgi:hypothetical protein
VSYRGRARRRDADAPRAAGVLGDSLSIVVTADPTATITLGVGSSAPVPLAAGVNQSGRRCCRACAVYVGVGARRDVRGDAQVSVTAGSNDLFIAVSVLGDKRTTRVAFFVRPSSDSLLAADLTWVLNRTFPATPSEQAALSDALARDIARAYPSVAASQVPCARVAASAPRGADAAHVCARRLWCSR